MLKLKTSWVLVQMGKLGTVEHNSNNDYWVNYKGHVISIIDQKGEALNLYVRQARFQDEPQSDYFAGDFPSSWKQALRFTQIN